MQEFEGGSAGMKVPEAEPIDASEHDRASKLAHEAAERLTFHRMEAERWDRIGRAATAAAQVLGAAAPMEKVTPDVWATVHSGSVEPTEMRF